MDIANIYIASFSHHPRPRHYASPVTNLIRQVSQLLRAELKELMDVAQTTMEPIEPYDEEW